MKSKIRLKLAKQTTPYHIACGVLVVLSGYFLSVWLGVGLWVSFLAIEVWNKAEWETSWNDFWQFACGMFCCTALLLIVKLVLKLLVGVTI